MSLINEIADMIAAERGHSRAMCNDRCHCYRLASIIVRTAQKSYADDRNRLAEMLDQRTTELQRLQRLVGEEA